MTRNQPTPAAVDTAIKNGLKALTQGYTVKQSAEVPEIWFAIKPDGSSYLVDTDRKTCECEQWKREGACKHEWLVDDARRFDELEA